MVRRSPRPPKAVPWAWSLVLGLALSGTAPAASSQAAFAAEAARLGGAPLLASASHDDEAHDDAASGHEDAHAHDHDHGHDHGHAGHDVGAPSLLGVRVLVTAADAPEARVLDAGTGAVVGRFTLPAAARAWALPGGRSALLVHRDADRVSVVDGGFTVIDHGDHLDLVLGPPFVVQTVNYGPAPDAVAVAGDAVAVRHAGDGSVVRLDARLIGVSLDHVYVAGDAGGPGSVAFADAHLVVADATTGTVRVVAPDGAEVVRFAGCSAAGDATPVASGVLVSCGDGVLVVEARAGGVWTARNLAYPAGTPAGARLAVPVGDPDHGRVLGTLAGRVAALDVAAGRWTTWEVPAAAALRLAGDRLVVLATDGRLWSLDPETGTALAGRRVLDGIIADGAVPAFVVFAGHAFVADAAHTVLKVVRLDDMAWALEVPLDVVPGSLALLAAPGAVAH